MFMLRKTHEAAMKKALESDEDTSAAIWQPAIDELKARNCQLVRQASTATKRALDAERMLEKLRPSADKWIAAQTKRKEARKVVK